MTYSPAFKAQMIKKMSGASATSASALAVETGVSVTTLWRWKQDASSVLDMSTDADPPRGKRTQDWSAEEKLRAVMETHGLSAPDLGAYLRQHGLHSDVLEGWRAEALAGLGSASRKGKPSAESKRIRELERDVRRKDRALAETTALLVLKKKLESLFEDEESDTNPKSDG